MEEVEDLINMKYMDSVSKDSLGNNAIEGMIAHLDPHSMYIPAVEVPEINEDLQGNFEGIGVEFQIFDDTVNVTNVLAGGPSDKAGLQTGDKFLKVGDSVVAGNGHLKRADPQAAARPRRQHASPSLYSGLASPQNP